MAFFGITTDATNKSLIINGKDRFLPSSGSEMLCIKAEIPDEICRVDDELKAIYHSKDTVCIWVLKTREDRNRFVDETMGMSKQQRADHFEAFYT